MQKLNKALQNSQWVKEIKGEIRKYLETRYKSEIRGDITTDATDIIRMVKCYEKGEGMKYTLVVTEQLWGFRGQCRI